LCCGDHRLVSRRTIFCTMSSCCSSASSSVRAP
jgi:hypothetical protein